MIGVKSVVNIKAVCRATVIAAMAVACSPAPEETGLLLTDAWVRAAPPGAGMNSAYGKFINHGRKPVKITGFSSQAFGLVSLHRTLVEGGIGRMEEVGALTVPAGGSFEMAPEAYHLMLMAPVDPLVAGDTIKIELESATGDSYSFTVTVERR